ncbi:MAG: apolipoprotein N-acyltransferase [Rhodobacteraceae bacterium]|nr:apolipoprotein N-acyltransferase [Paracoccaceae bacterium]MBR9820264.1 apolipoprotein N-acyltransferase [Paracoccaceae bacterium]
MPLPPRLLRFWPLLAGALTASAQAPLSLWPMAFLGFAALAQAHLSVGTPRGAAFRGWLFGTGYFAAALFWIVEPFMVDAARDGWMAPFALVLMATGLALFWGGALWAAKALAPRGRVAALAFAGALVLAEALRGWIFTGFPWALIGHGLIASPLLPLAAFGGAHGLGLLVLLPAALLGRAIARRRLLPGGVAVLIFIAALSLSLVLPPRALPAGPDAPLIRLVQPNAAQREKWDPEMVPVFWRRMLSYTAASRPDQRRPDLVIWPETSVPYLLNEGEALTEVLAEAARGSALAVGIQRREGARYYNSLAVLDRSGEIHDVYDKHHLVPFGEYLPLGDQLAKLGIRAFAAQEGFGYSAGPGAALLQIPGIGATLPLICYEAIFPRDIRAAPARPDLLLQVTNDAWFGSLSGPYQHLAQARLRAVENGLPMIRVANTGVSALISADGAVLDSLALNTEGFLDLALPPPSAPTPYSRSGDLPALLLALLLLFSALPGLIHRRLGALS